ncbi:MAG TPA: 50S ribosomal protein L34 [Nitrospiria bacterium]|nr:50S ribosomal protein L34 [Nitrospiria bacterium]
MSITYRQPSKRRKKKTHGFLTRMKSKGGRRALSRRRSKGRRKLTA